MQSILQITLSSLVLAIETIIFIPLRCRYYRLIILAATLEIQCRGHGMTKITIDTDRRDMWTTQPEPTYHPRRSLPLHQGVNPSSQARPDQLSTKERKSHIHHPSISSSDAMTPKLPPFHLHLCHRSPRSDGLETLKHIPLPKGEEEDVAAVVVAVLAPPRGRLFGPRWRGPGRPIPGDAEAVGKKCSSAIWRSLAMRWVMALGVTSWFGGCVS